VCLVSPTIVDVLDVQDLLPNLGQVLFQLLEGSEVLVK